MCKASWTNTIISILSATTSRALENDIKLNANHKVKLNENKHNLFGNKFEIYLL